MVQDSNSGKSVTKKDTRQAMCFHVLCLCMLLPVALKNESRDAGYLEKTKLRHDYDDTTIVISYFLMMLHASVAWVA